MNKEINLELRSEILDMSLTLESSINQLITVYLNIEHPNPKAIGNKSNSLSFKNKLDLLNDLEIISKEDYLKLLLIMEFRNQFLHNIDCTSFIKAVDLLGSDKGKQLLKFDDLDFEAEQEYRYNNAYKGLFVNCLDIILNKFDKRREMYAAKREMFTDMSNFWEYLLDVDDEIITEVIIMCMPHNGDDTKLANFKSRVFAFINDGLEKGQSTDKYTQLKSRLESYDEVKITRLIK